MKQLELFPTLNEKMKELVDMSIEAGGYQEIARFANKQQPNTSDRTNNNAEKSEQTEK